MEEIWKDIIGYEGIYQVSNIGRVKSLSGICKNNHRTFYKKGKILAITDNGKGYKIVSLSICGRKNHYVHRLVCSAFIENKKNYPQVNHIDGVKGNNFASNLEWSSKENNIQHAYDIGLQPKRGDRINAIKVLDIETNQVFDCIKSASEFYNIKYALMKQALNRKSKPKHPIYYKLIRMDRFIENNVEQAKELGYSLNRLDKC